MTRIPRSRPSASLVISIAALVVALSGTAIAASQMNGDGLIRRNTLSGNRLRDHTITAGQLNLRRLGKVPKAALADFATAAGSATDATSATNATNAVNAANATNAGHAASADTAANATRADTATRADSAASTDGFTNSGLVTLTASSTAPGTQQTLASRGPFSFLAQCLKNAGGTITADVVVKDLSASGAIEEDASDQNSSPPSVLDAGATHSLFHTTTASTPTWHGAGDNLFSVAAPGSVAVSGTGSLGVNILGADCAFQLVTFG